MQKYIPLYVIDCLEIWMQLDNVANILKSQLAPNPTYEESTNTKNSSKFDMECMSHAKIHKIFNTLTKTQEGTGFYKSHIVEHVKDDSNISHRSFLLMLYGVETTLQL